MADWGQIIAGIDGYRNYENNRALDLQNQAQLIQNQANDIRKNEMMTINDIKGQIAALSDNPYAKLNAWDPQARGQQLLNEDKQLKIASKWASSIKNLAPEKRAQGYAQFLRAMPGLGIDVSDMPQAYDEAYINQLADLGIETETRYQNEQQNARQDKQIAATQANLERQIAANREARQDEFNKKLAAFDYENSYRTQAEKDKQAQIDSMIDASTLSPDDKERAKLAYRNITLPGVKTPQERLMEQFTNPDATDEQRAAARQGLMRIAELQKEIKDLEPVKPVSAKDKASAMNYVSSAVKEGTMTPEQGSAYYEGLTGDSVDFSTPTKKYAAGDVGTMQFLMDNGYSADGARQAVGKATPEEKLQIEQEKSDINTASAIKINAAKAQDDRDTKVIMAGINADNAELQAQRNFAREQQLIALKDSLPTPKQKEISAAAQALGIPEEQLYQMSLNKQQAEIDLSKKRGDLINAQIGQTLANTEKTQKEAETTGMSEPEKKYNWIRNNPDVVEWSEQNPQAAQMVFGTKNGSVDKGETELRKEFNQLTKDYRVVGDSYMRILKASEKPSAAGDLSLIFNYMKMLDPNSVVRESEFSNAESARAWFDETGAPTAVRLAYQKSKNGQRLLKEQREDFVNMATQLMAAQKESFDQYAKQYTDIALNSGYDPTRVVFNPYASLENNGNTQGDNDYNLAVGTVDGDYRYIGGNPANSESWEKIK